MSDLIDTWVDEAPWRQPSPSWEASQRRRQRQESARDGRRGDRFEKLLKAVRAQLEAGAKGARSQGAKSFTIDPTNPAQTVLDLLSDGHPGAFGELGYEMLRNLARTEFVQAVINTRAGQVSAFCVPSEDEHTPGFRIVSKDKQKGRSSTSKDTFRAQEISDWLMTCGDPSNHDFPVDLPTLVRMETEDSLTFDQLNMELVKTVGGGLSGFVPVDAATIRRAQLTGDELRHGRRNPVHGYCQVIRGQVVQEFTQEEMIFAVRRPRTQVDVCGYGNPELITVLGSVIYLLESEAWNRNNFRTGVQASGVLAIMSEMDSDVFDDFKEDFYDMLAGRKGAHRVPLLQLNPEEKESIAHIDLGRTNRDMEYASWNQWLMKKILMLFGMDPSELGFLFGQEGVTQTLSQQGPADRIAYSRERGLRPLLDFWQGIFNRIIALVDDRFCLEWTGLDVDSPAERLEGRIKRVTNYTTINEAREEEGLEAIQAPWGDLPNNPSIINFAMATQPPGQEPAGPQGQQPGQEPAGGQEEDGFDFDNFDIDSLFAGSALSGSGKADKEAA